MWNRNASVAYVSSEASDSPGWLPACLQSTFWMAVATGRNFNYAVGKMIEWFWRWWQLWLWPLEWTWSFIQGCTSLGLKVAFATKLCTLAPNIFAGLSVELGLLAQVTLHGVFLDNRVSKECMCMTCMIRGSDGGVVEDSSLLGCDTM
jgi:hypothetical protein